jgi:hypothetical protein
VYIYLGQLSLRLANNKTWGVDKRWLPAKGSLRHMHTATTRCGLVCDAAHVWYRSGPARSLRNVLIIHPHEPVFGDGRSSWELHRPPELLPEPWAVVLYWPALGDRPWTPPALGSAPPPWGSSVCLEPPFLELQTTLAWLYPTQRIPAEGFQQS